MPPIQLYGRNTETGECGYFNLAASNTTPTASVVDANLTGTVISFTDADGNTVYSVDILSAVSTDDQYATIEAATEAGTDAAGNAYVTGDTLLVTAVGDKLSMEKTIDTDTYSVVAVASAAGTDFTGNAYDPGDRLLVQPNGQTYLIEDTTVSDAVDTFAVSSIATEPGTDSAGNAYSAGDLLVTLPGGEFFSVVQLTTDGITENCCAGAPIVASQSGGNVYSGICGDPNIITPGPAGAYLLDTTVLPENIYRSDGNEWEIIPIGTIANGTFFQCTNVNSGYLFNQFNTTWTLAQQPALVDPDDPDSWPVATGDYAFHPVISESGCMLGFVDRSGGHPICCPIIDPLYIDSSVIYGDRLSGACGDPNITPVAASGSNLLDTSVSPHNLFISDGSQWELVPRNTILANTEFNCTNVSSQYVFDITSQQWVVGSQPAVPIADDPSTWGATEGCKVRFVIDEDGTLIGIVNNTGGVAIAQPDTSVPASGTSAPAGTPDFPFYIQTNVFNGQTDQNDLTILWWHDGAQWFRVNDLVMQAASTTASGLVELATNSEAMDPTINTLALTPSTLWHVLNTVDDMHAVGWDGYDATTNTLTLRMDDGTTLPVDLTALINDAIATVPPATTTQQGIVELATVAETQAGTDDTRAVTPQGLKDALADLLCSTIPEATAAQIAAADDTDHAMICVDGELVRVQLSTLGQLLNGTPVASLYPEWFNAVAGDRSMVVDYNQNNNSPNPTGASFTVGPDGAYIKLYAADWYENDTTGAIRSVTARQWFAHVNPGDVVTVGSLAAGKVDVNGVTWVGNDFVAQQPLIDALVYTAPTEWTANGSVYGKFLDGTPAAFGFNGPGATDRFMPRYLDTDLPGTTEPHTGSSVGSDIEQVADGGAPLSSYDGLEKEYVIYQRQTDVVGGSRTIAAAVNEVETYYFGALVGNSNLSGAVDYTKIGAIVYKASGYREPTGYLDNQTAYDRGGNADVPSGGLV